MRKVMKDLTPPIVWRAAKRVAGKPVLPEEDSHFTPRHLELKEEHLRRNRGLPPDRICLREGIQLRLHPESRFGVEFFCYRAPFMVDEMDCFLARTKNKKNLLDIGALHGVFSMAFLSSGSGRRAVAVDASPLAFGRLLYNLHANKFENITPVELALSDGEGALEMHYEGEHMVAAELDQPGLEFNRIERRTGDGLCRELGFEPDVIKIDVEGHEVKVLQGLSGILEKFRPLLFLEVHPHRIAGEGKKMEDLESILGRFGYRAELVEGGAFPLEKLRSLQEDSRLVLEAERG